MQRLARHDLVLLLLLTLAWGLSWPVMKVGVQGLPPLFFRLLCIAGGLVVLAAYARVAGVPLRVPRADWGDVVRLAVPNVVVWHVLAIVAVSLLPAGRSALLGYTMPVWVVVFGLLCFGEVAAGRARGGGGGAVGGPPFVGGGGPPRHACGEGGML